ncbi:MAG: hypothetical protein AMJ67_10740 [Betaproteobacteria bacterium SG8_41]|nr:MAG: hypothetical protein AMJ67_10740 [Betaproteobacteria bacterium SG8_41]
MAGAARISATGGYRTQLRRHARRPACRGSPRNPGARAALGRARRAAPGPGGRDGASVRRGSVRRTEDPRARARQGWPRPGAHVHAGLVVRDQR